MILKRPFIVPVFIPHEGCPHRCVFCNQKAITGEQRKIPSPEEFRSHVNSFLEFNADPDRIPQIAFYGGNFLGLSKEKASMLLAEAENYVRENRVGGMRFSTRPDTIDKKRLDLIQNFSVSAVELGVQSLDDRVLDLSKRGHTSRDSERAVRLLNENGYETGVQLMSGLPGDDENGAMETVEKTAALSPAFVRIYPTVVIRNSPLEKMHTAGEYKTMSLERSVALVKNMYEFFLGKDIPVIRMGLQASEDLDGASVVAGPYHPAFGHLVYSKFFLDKAVSAIESKNLDSDSIAIRVHPRSVPKMRGMKNGNIELIRKRFGLVSVEIAGDSSLGLSELTVGRGRGKTPPVREIRAIL